DHRHRRAPGRASRRRRRRGGAASGRPPGQRPRGGRGPARRRLR
ncbi:MAG: hypothetical protein AVDCRST_MAG66-1611, partial [uncultured Pseudonocardia sp.]